MAVTADIVVSSDYKETILRLPNFISLVPYRVRCHTEEREASRQSEQWLLSMANFSQKQRNHFIASKAGLLACMCYIDCTFDELRVCTDFMNFIFALDDWSDEFDTDGTLGLAQCVMNTLYWPHSYHAEAGVHKLAKDLWVRMQETAGPGCQQRFMSALDIFLDAVTQQAADRGSHNIPDLEDYILLRRDSSGCKTLFALIEYAANVDLPWDVIDHPVVKALSDAANDLVSWVNDVVSYNAEQSRGDTHNIVCVLMNQNGVNRQEALEVVGELWERTLHRFFKLCKTVPSWDPEIDRAIGLYIRGLEDCIIANAEWSFVSERYFGKEGHIVKKTQQIALLPPRAHV